MAQPSGRAFDAAACTAQPPSPSSAPHESAKYVMHVRRARVEVDRAPHVEGARLAVLGRRRTSRRGRSSTSSSHARAAEHLRSRAAPHRAAPRRRPIDCASAVEVPVGAERLCCCWVVHVGRAHVVQLRQLHGTATVVLRYGSGERRTRIGSARPCVQVERLEMARSATMGSIFSGMSGDVFQAYGTARCTARGGRRAAVAAAAALRRRLTGTTEWLTRSAPSCAWSAPRNRLEAARARRARGRQHQRTRDIRGGPSPGDDDECRSSIPRASSQKRHDERGDTRTVSRSTMEAS